MARTEWCEAHSVKNESKPPVQTNEKPLPVPAKEEAAPPKVEVKPAPQVPAPNSAPPPTVSVEVPAPSPAEAPEPEPPFEQVMGKKVAGDLRKLQAYYNAKLTPPIDWETLWQTEGTDLYNLSERKDGMSWEMVKDCIVVSQVNHATRYTRPALIAGNISELAEEVLALRIADKMAPLWNSYLLGLGYPKEVEKGGTAYLEAQRSKENNLMLKRWTEWMEKHLQPQANG